MTFLLRPLNSKDDTIITMNPDPGFVVKSKIEVSKDSRFLSHTKIFINICYHKEVPVPEVDFNASSVYPLIMNNQWEIPIVTSSFREDKDKKGLVCYVCDCCINTRCMSWINKDYQLREILIEWCIESCELRGQMTISRDNLAFPNLKRKGKIPPLKLLSQDISYDYRHEMNSIIEQERNDPSSILEMKRDLLEENYDTNTDGDKLPPLFPIHSSETKKPLIQEIEGLNLQRTEFKPMKYQEQSLEYSVIMGKTRDLSIYKIKIEVTSELSSGLDYDLKYNKKENLLIVSNKHTELFKYKTLEIPLPNIFKGVPSFRSFFIKGEKKLMIFL